MASPRSASLNGVEPALASAGAREDLRALAEEQTALRRVAELVARGVSQDEIFSSVAVETSRLIDDQAATLLRLDRDGAFTVVASCNGPAPVGTRAAVAPDDAGVVARILRTGRPARLDSYTGISGPAWARDDYGIASSVGVPVFVEDRLWGMLGVTSPDRPLPVGAEPRLAAFAELITAALANALARTALQEMADEQGALRRVAELVARGVPADRLFTAVAAEASNLVGGAPTALARFEPADVIVIVAQHRGPVPTGTRIPYKPGTLPDRTRRSDRTVRVDDYAREADAELGAQYGLRAAVTAPIPVDGRVWGMLKTTSSQGPLPPGTEQRLQAFADLVASAIANTEARAELRASRARVVATADDTRRRLQRDVHDGAQQRLVQTTLTLKLAREALQAGDAAAAAALVEESLANTEQATSGLRDIVRGILPASLTRGGLRAGVESLAADLPLPVEVDLDVPRLLAAIETNAYFVVAESLTNVVKHAAGATRAHVSGRAGPDGLVVEVRDDGAGGADPDAGSGLTGLFDRVHAMEGTLTIVSPQGGGTTVRAVLPLAAG